MGFNQRDYQEEYAEDFADALGYEIYDKDNLKVVKIKMDYIKHNSIVAFPAPILIKEKPSEIKYQLRSKHLTEVVEGIITVLDN